MKAIHALAAAALMLSATPALAQEAPAPGWMEAPRDWGTTLRQDATALHAVIIDSHPGVYDAQNPGFRARVDEGLALALKRAETTTTAGGWWWTLRAFVGSFDDGHVQMGLTDQSAGFPTRWPGFLTVYRGGDQVVADRDATDAATPPLGARLIDCDGVAAEQMGAERIGAFRGRWFLESQHAVLGDWQFMNASNPWLAEMRHCRFESEGEVKSYALTWRGITAADLSARRAPLTQRARPAFGVKQLDDGGFWLSMPSFDGSPGSDAHTALTAMIAEATAKQSDLRAAPYVVLDLRGNGGGSSHWSQSLATVLWNDGWIRTHDLPPIEAIEWRASADNQAAIQSYVDEWTAAGESAERIAWAQQIVDGMTGARAAGQPYWRDAASPADAAAAVTDVTPGITGRVYLLTDPFCASACLDAVDLWKALGAVQIGRETSADTVYMDVRDTTLPSGLAALVIPMKVWRGRARGNNEPQRPVHVFDGDMTNEAELAAWVRSLN